MQRIILSRIMKRAWKYVRKFAMSIAKALKRSWAIHLKAKVKGYMRNTDKSVLVYILTGDTKPLTYPQLYY